MRTKAEIEDKMNYCKKWLNLGIKSRNWGLAEIEAFRINLLGWVLDEPKPEAKE